MNCKPDLMALQENCCHKALYLNYSVALFELTETLDLADVNKINELVYTCTQKQPGCKKRCGSVQNGQCEKSYAIKEGG